MTAGCLRSCYDKRRVLFDRGIDRERSRWWRDVYRQDREMKSAGEPGLPARRCSLDARARRKVADEIFFADQRVGRRIERRRRASDLFAVALDNVIERRGLDSQRNFG